MVIIKIVDYYRQVTADTVSYQATDSLCSAPLAYKCVIDSM